MYRQVIPVLDPLVQKRRHAVRWPVSRRAGVPPGAAAERFTAPQPQFVRSLGRSNWLATVDGTAVVARAVDAPPSGAWAGTAQRAMARCTALVPVLGWAERDGRWWLLSSYVPAVSLDRLLSTVTLTPRQAGYLARELLAVVGHLHEAGLAHTRLNAASVLVDGAGALHLSDWALAQAACDEGTVAADTAATRLLVAAVTRNAGGPTRRGRGSDVLLVSLLERCASEQQSAPLAESGAIDAALAASRDTGAAAQARAGLQAMVATLTERPPSVHGWPSAQRPSAQRPSHAPLHAASQPPSPTVLQPPSRTASHVASHTAAPRWQPQPGGRVWRAAGIAVAVVVALGVGGYFVVDRLAIPRSTGTRAEAAAGAGIVHTPRALPSLPTATGVIRGLDVRPLTACRSGGVCQVRVAVQLTPVAKAQRVHWTLNAIDRCGTATKRVSSGALPVRAHRSYTYTTVRVRMPSSGSLALIASTDAPARASSSPLLVPVSGGRC